MSEKKHADIIEAIRNLFPTFGAGQEFKNINKTALALEDEPLCFAAGVDVADVVEVVLRDYNSYEQDQETIKALDALITEIEAVACGEEQIQADGVYDDSDGLKWIYDRIQSARATIAKTALALAKKE